MPLSKLVKSLGNAYATSKNWLKKGIGVAKDFTVEHGAGILGTGIGALATAYGQPKLASKAGSMVQGIGDYLGKDSKYGKQLTNLGKGITGEYAGEKIIEPLFAKKTPGQSDDDDKNDETNSKYYFRRRYRNPLHLPGHYSSVIAPVSKKKFSVSDKILRSINKRNRAFKLFHY